MIELGSKKKENYRKDQARKGSLAASWKQKKIILPACAIIGLT